MEARYIYGLYDPRNPTVVTCVGKTKNSLAVRLAGYVAASRRHGSGTTRRSYQWILSLMAVGIRPKIRLLATSNKQNWKATETRFISFWRRKNTALLNDRTGGDGPDSPQAKLFCDKHPNVRRGVWPRGSRYCSECEHERRCSPEARKWNRDYRNKRDLRQAESLGLTVKQFRSLRPA
jgi:hypothetical protein